MRRCMLDDLLAGARRLALAASEERSGLADQLIYEAHAAHHYCKRFRHPHPRWGNGSLMARALQDGPWPTRALCFECLAIMAAAVTRFHNRAGCARVGLLR